MSNGVLAWLAANDHWLVSCLDTFIDCRYLCIGLATDFCVFCFLMSLFGVCCRSFHYLFYSNLLQNSNILSLIAIGWNIFVYDICVGLICHMAIATFGFGISVLFLDLMPVLFSFILFILLNNRLFNAKVTLPFFFFFFFFFGNNYIVSNN